MGFDSFAPAFLPVDQSEDAEDVRAVLAEHVDRLEGRSAGRNHVFDDDHAISLAIRPLHLTPCAVTLGFLANREGSHRLRSGGAGVRDGIGDWIGAEGEASNGVDLWAKHTSRHLET